MISIEAVISSMVVITVFAVFLTVVGYFSALKSVNDFIHSKAETIAVVSHGAKMDLHGVIDSKGYKNIKNGRVENLFLTYVTQGDEIRIFAFFYYKGLLGKFRMKSECCVTVWHGDVQKNEKTVWDLSPIERGKKIEEIFGSDLPEFFPVLDSFEPVTGHAISITSIDTTAKQYETGIKIKEVILEKAAELRRFTYAECEDIIIRDMDIDSKELIIVLPQNSLSNIQRKYLEEVLSTVKNYGMEINLKRYQYAKRYSEIWGE